jgi:Type II secretion system (T2SS), protein E, N-terminal domain
MRQEALALALEDEQTSRTEFGTGLRARLELVRVRSEPALPPIRRDISPELMLVSPESPTTEGVLAALLTDPIRAAKRLPLGALLREAGLLDPAEIDFALVRAKEQGRRLGEIVIEYGLVTQNDIVRLVAEQRGVPYVDIAPLAVDPAAAKLLPADYARELRTLPIGFMRGLPVVALADPSDELTMRDTRSILRAAEFVASPEDSLLEQLARVYLGD